MQYVVPLASVSGTLGVAWPHRGHIRGKHPLPFLPSDQSPKRTALLVAAVVVLASGMRQFPLRPPLRFHVSKRTVRYVRIAKRLWP